MDKLGFYCYESDRYEVNYIGLLLKKIVEVVIDFAAKREKLTNGQPYVFLTADMINNQQNNQEPLPDFILKSDLPTIREWFIAKVLIHEMAHAFLDLPGKPHINFLEESMANLITISVAEYFGDNNFFQFVLWFIENQSANYCFAINLYDAAKNKGITSVDLLNSALNWAKCVTKDPKIFETYNAQAIIFNQQNSSRAALADRIINDLSDIKSSVRGSGYSLLEIKTWEFIVDICFKNYLAVKNYDPTEVLSGTVTVYAQNKHKDRNIKIATLIRNYFDFLCSNKSWEEWKKKWNGYNSQIYELLPHTLKDLEEILGPV